MPELPDVAVFQRYIDSTSLHQPIEQVRVHDAGVLKGVSARRLRSQLQGRSFESTRRHGKYLFVETGTAGVPTGTAGLPTGGPWLILHFGMTGRPQYYKDPDRAPAHARVVFEFAGGYRLAYDCQRKLGRVSLTADPDQFIEQQELGTDALDEELDVDRFCELLAGRRGTIKSALMTQEMLAGVGNIYSDEILFQARVHPQTPVENLDRRTLQAIYRALHKVLETAIERNVEDFPRTWLLPNRDGRCARCGTPIRTARVAGRTARFCPKCQRKH